MRTRASSTVRERPSLRAPTVTSQLSLACAAWKWRTHDLRPNTDACACRKSARPTLAKRTSLTGQSSAKRCSSRHRSDEGRGGDTFGEEEDDAVEGPGNLVVTLEGLDCIVRLAGWCLRMVGGAAHACAASGVSTVSVRDWAIVGMRIVLMQRAWSGLRRPWSRRRWEGMRRKARSRRRLVGMMTGGGCENTVIEADVVCPKVLAGKQACYLAFRCCSAC